MITEDRIREIVREELGIHPRGEIGSQELAPSPPKSAKQGRRMLKGKRIKMASNVDAELYRLLDEKRLATGHTINHILDSALWLYFGKPKLSFELEDK
jgi:hypothetical protein